MPIEKKTLVLRSLHRISEYRDGAVFKTEYVCDVWVDPDWPNPKGYQFVSVSYTDRATIGTLRAV